VLRAARNGVVLCLDSRYVWPACVAIRSLVRSWRRKRPIIVYCLCDTSVGPDDLAALKAAAVSGPGRLKVIQHPFSFPDMRIGYITPMGYARLIAPQLIDAQFLLYLDCDMLACVSVDTLFRPIADGCPIAAVRDPYIPELGTPHVEQSRFPLNGRSSQDPYFNSGLLLIDVARWRSERLSQRAMELVGSLDWRPLFGDQDTLNFLVEGRFELLDPRWNVMPVSVIQGTLDFTFHGERYVPMPYQRSLEQSPWIMHYATEVKPWTTSFADGPLRRRWEKVAAEAAEAVAVAGVALPSVDTEVRPAAAGAGPDDLRPNR
jgi:lipopolysaccharide biosynthesis glycosyltransferase